MENAIKAVPPVDRVKAGGCEKSIFLVFEVASDAHVFALISSTPAYLKKRKGKGE